MLFQSLESNKMPPQFLCSLWEAWHGNLDAVGYPPLKEALCALIYDGNCEGFSSLCSVTLMVPNGKIFV